jgi:hypothetical protein
VSAEGIIRAALAARTLGDAEHLDRMIATEMGAEHYRPIGDRVNNFGLMTASGSYDYKLIENVTNMQDALLERAAMERFGDLSSVPYMTPHNAAAHLYIGRGDADLAACASVDFYQGEIDARKSGTLTPVFRDEGCGIEPSYVGDSIFALGSAHKSKSVWQQGAFGIGGATTFRNADAVILVSRRAPEMRPEEDRILLAVCLWQKSLKGKGLFYLVTTSWDSGRNPRAVPWSAPASEFPDFAPGTHLALIEYGTEKLHTRRHPDNPNSFDRILDTRLFSPVSPVRFRNHLIRDDHARVRRGLRRRFEDNQRDDRRESTEHMQFRVGGVTYELPVSYYFFDAARRAEGDGGTVGSKTNFVAYGHSLMFTSNGQAHHHWTPLNFRDRTKLNKIAEHVLVVVETDPLPIAVRTDFFTADRSGVRASRETLRLEAETAKFLADWDDLKEINGQLIMESLRSSRNGRPTLEVSRQISRAFAARLNGFSLHASNGNGAFGTDTGGRGLKSPLVLHADPTRLRGPGRIVAERGATKSMRYVLDATDEFMSSGRGRLTVTCTHPEIGDRDITVGPLHNGRVRVFVTVPEEAELGEYSLVAGVYGWERAAGGLGDDLEWTTKFSRWWTRSSRSPSSRRERRSPSRTAVLRSPCCGAGTMRRASLPSCPARSRRFRPTCWPTSPSTPSWRSAAMQWCSRST